jgi:predicted  nucleic acid-binding Zn-ribbon protein
MRRPGPSRGTIRPKITTMPRQKSEAAAFLNIYKLVIEKKRLQEELENIETRRQQIYQRLEVLDKQVEGLEQSVQKIRQHEAEGQSATPNLNREPQSDSFDTLFLEY